MKVLVFSDSHHILGNMYDAVEHERPDMVLHLGDCTADAEDLSNAFGGLDLLFVPGNCDPFSPAAPTLFQELGGKRVFMTHGHLFGVKNGLLRLEQEAKRLGADVALFGHTHCPYLRQEDGVWLLNPGSCAHRGCYGVLEIDHNELQCALRELP